MKLGYMSGFRGELIDEINFSKQHFDFTEITIKPELLKTIDNNLINTLKDITHGFETLGHIHREITKTNEIIKNIEILKQLGAKKITIHPFENFSIEENIKIFKEINIFLQDNEMNLLIENVSNPPFNQSENINKIIENIPNSNITLDVGHANRISELDKFLNIFKGKIGHIHLHDNLDQLDHMFYENGEKANQIINKIISVGYNDTILLETFSVLKDGKNVSQNFEEIKELHKQQLEKIRKNKK